MCLFTAPSLLLGLALVACSGSAGGVDGFDSGQDKGPSTGGEQSTLSDSIGGDEPAGGGGNGVGTGGDEPAGSGGGEASGGGDAGTGGEPAGSGGEATGTGGAEPEAPPLPRPLRVWVLDDRNIQEQDFEQYSRWYDEVDGNKQVFNLYEGDKTLRGDGVTWHARIEVHSGLAFQPGDGWHVFEATYKIDSSFNNDIAIAQLFDYSEVHPQIMVIFKDGNRVTYQFRGEGNKEAGVGYRDKPFTIKIRSNGTDGELYFNGELQHAGKLPNTAPSARNGFRWGLYYGGIAPGAVRSEVTHVTREKE